MAKNRQWIYARKPNAEVGPGEFRSERCEVPEAGEGQVLVKTTLLSARSSEPRVDARARRIAPRSIPAM